MQKLVTLILFTLLLASSLSGQDWTRQNPLPSGSPYETVFFSDPMNGYAVGWCGTMIRTTNGGALN